MSARYKHESIHRLALQLRLDHGFAEDASEQVARELIESTDGWQPAHTLALLAENTPIVGRDCNGYVHDATHLAGSKDSWWVDAWKFIARQA